MNKVEKKAFKYFDFLKGFDLFGVNIDFRIDNKWLHNSVCGGFFSLAFMIFSIMYIFNNFRDFISRSNMSLIFINKVLESNPKVNLTQNKFNLAFGLTFQNSTVADHLEYFDYSLELVQWIGIDTFIIKTIPLVNCEYQNFHGVSEA